MVEVPSGGLSPLEGRKWPVQTREASSVFCPLFTGKSLEQEGTPVLYSNGWLYPAIKVSGVNLS